MEAWFGVVYLGLLAAVLLGVYEAVSRSSGRH